MNLDFSHINYVDGVAQILASSSLLQQKKETTLLSIGVDEAGRGPLLGPVSVASVMLNPEQPIDGLNDSKKLSEKKRLALYEEIIQKALSYSVVFISAQKIDEINILQATLLGMRQSVLTMEAMTTEHVEEVRIDGNKSVELPYACTAIIGGDALHAEISAASILAKVTRDAYMYDLHEQYPHFSINKHKGYPTKLHKEMLEQHGVLPDHRRSFKPISMML